tara:strand:- start:437 stop:622 length:186 start_codon:yes stop_codon:yes gene_type:complete
MNKHVEWLMVHASFSYGETEEASKNFHGLVQYIERLKSTVASKEKYISELEDANWPEEETP